MGKLMYNLSNDDYSDFLELFIYSACVSNFSESEFNDFTLNSIGLPLCLKYRKTPWDSFKAFIDEAEYIEHIKLFKSLLSHYEAHYLPKTLPPTPLKSSRLSPYRIQSFEEKQMERNYVQYELYKKCRLILDMVQPSAVPLATSAKSLAQKFSSEYLSAQINLMLKMATENPTEAIGKSKELIESCCKTILEAKNVTTNKTWDMGDLIKETTALLELSPENIPDNSEETKAIKKILGSLQTIIFNVAKLRNAHGSGHGKSANYMGLEVRHAKLTVGCAITLAQFLWDSHERKIGL